MSSTAGDSHARDRSGPLADVVVLDLTRVLAGPLATQQFADFGARVIKVEPIEGDATRGWGPPFFDPDRSGYFLACNRGKESVALDLGRPAGLEILDRLVASADVVIENYRPGTLERWGRSLEAWRREHPGLVTATIASFGTGTERESQGGYDALIQATSGLMAISGPIDGPPSKVGVALVDVQTGLQAAIGVLAALRRRGEADFAEYRHVEVALSEAALYGLVNVAAAAVNDLGVAQRWGNEHPTIVPYAPYPVRDGMIFIAVGSDAIWRRLAEVLGHPEWGRDPHPWVTNRGRVEDRESLTEALREALGTRDRDELVAALIAARVPAGPIASVEEAIEHPDTDGRGMVVRHDDGAKTVASPIRLGRGTTLESLGSAASPPPHLGEHTRAVLVSIGYTAEQIGRWFEDGVLGG